MSTSTEPQPPIGVVALNRLGFGPTAESLAHFVSLGSNTNQRLGGWLDQQLDPASIDDSDCDARISAAGYQTLGKNYDRLWNEHFLVQDQLGYIEAWRPMTETRLVTFLRAVHSKRQLKELMVRFWHDHFNVHGEDAGPTFADYDRQVIRKNVFGKFRTLLGAATKHPVMLEYLNNNVNSFEPELENDGLNENFARELLELHTIGAEHYFPDLSPNQVPTHPDGTPRGYTDVDVTMAARCLTGWTYRNMPWDDEVGNNGRFVALSRWHDTVNTKRVLGEHLTSRHVVTDGEQLLDLLANHPATARFIATKLCRRLVADKPPADLVDHAAQVFFNNRHAADQIGRTVRAIAMSSAFRTTWGCKMKRPFELFISALRACSSQHRFAHDDHDLGMMYWFYQTGHLPFEWHPPNGYPDFKEAWMSSSPRVLGWHMLNWMTDDKVPGTEQYLMDVASQTPAHRNTPRKVVEYWIGRIFARDIPAAEYQVFLDFIRLDLAPDQEYHLDDSWLYRPRLRGLVGIMLMSPRYSYL